VQAVFNLSRKFSLKANYGYYYQFANRVLREDILSGSRDFWILSNGNEIPISKAQHYIAGASFNTDMFLFSAEAYYKKLDGLTEYTLRINPNPFNIDYNENFYNGNGYSKGVELMVQKKSGRFNGWMSYTLGESRNHFAVYSNEYFPAYQDVTHEFKSVNIYEWKRWQFALTWIYATGRPYSAPAGAYNVNLLDGSTENYFTITSKNSLRLPDYHRLDIAANFKLMGGIDADRREIGYIGFSIMNVYSRKNVWYKQFDIVENQIVETNINYLGFTPNITLSLKLR
jgi:hypothetical protein